MNTKTIQQSLANAIEHTLLRPNASLKDLEKLCEEALEWNFVAVCVHPYWCDAAKKLLRGSKVKLVTVAGFPLGIQPLLIKLKELEYAMAQGADEIDFVVNPSEVKAGQFTPIENEFSALKKGAGSIPLKVILETCDLIDAEKTKLCQLAAQTGLAFVKTSTGFGKSGATVADVRLMAGAVNGKAQVKASGGIRDLDTALKMLEAGASRLGTSSGVQIMQAVDHARI